jgi:hypothetical protein
MNDSKCMFFCLSINIASLFLMFLLGYWNIGAITYLLLTILFNSIAWRYALMLEKSAA